MDMKSVMMEEVKASLMVVYLLDRTSVVNTAALEASTKEMTLAASADMIFVKRTHGFGQRSIRVRPYWPGNDVHR